MKKGQLRSIYLEKQRTLRPQRRDSDSILIANRFFDSFDLSAIQVLHTFIPIPKFNEVDTRLIVQKIWRDHPNIQVAVPRVDFETNELTSLRFHADTILEKNAWDIDEPAHDEFVNAEQIDLVIVPGLCFDRGGHRVGYGKGFYDRFLKTCRSECVKVGLSYWEPVADIEDLHDGDVPVDVVITPDKYQNLER